MTYLIRGHNSQIVHYFWVCETLAEDAPFIKFTNKVEAEQALLMMQLAEPNTNIKFKLIDLDLYSVKMVKDISKM